MAMSLAYPLAPIAGYLVAGSLKFIVNSFRSGGFAFDRVGLGGWPSTHNTITSTVVSVTALGEGLHSPIVAVALGLALIVAIDSMDLRRKVGRHAETLKRALPTDAEAQRLRTAIGHTPTEAASGWMVGGLLGWALHAAFVTS